MTRSRALLLFGVLAASACALNPQPIPPEDGETGATDNSASGGLGPPRSPDGGPATGGNSSSGGKSSSSSGGASSSSGGPPSDGGVQPDGGAEVDAGDAGEPDAGSADAGDLPDAD